VAGNYVDKLHQAKRHVLTDSLYIDALVVVLLSCSMSQQKGNTKLLPISSPNIDRFRKLFQCHAVEEICNKAIIKYSKMVNIIVKMWSIVSVFIC